ncbi:hypothetical protein DASC09_042660 [Saccharomycopsis crataegensis]|uniref:Uncharacterized protein n=1 Tax=Saccharomycopsis crataegensis TaxID=43959 RepID=A0AAV5QQE0_9ASCO|nr:hypothetical protein DASC09_042660 [Saccharomycopsis crataegensis]
MSLFRPVTHALRVARTPKTFTAYRLPAMKKQDLINYGQKRTSIVSVHRDTKEDNPEIPFEFTAENMERAKEIIAKYPSQYKKAATMPLLDLGQRQLGFTSISLMNYVAKLVDIPPMRVYEVATFYTMYMRHPMGKFNIQCCTTTPCQLRGSDDIMKAIEDFTKVHPGDTTADKLFTFQEVECLGACANGPMMAINDDFYEDLTYDSTIAILEGFKSGNIPKPGPVSGRKTIEPIEGQTTLLGKEPTDMRKFTRSDL